MSESFDRDLPGRPALAPLDRGSLAAVPLAPGRPRLPDAPEFGDDEMKRLGEILVESKAISEKTRDEALAFAKENGGTFGSALLEAGALPERLLLRALSVQSFSPPASARDLASIPAGVIALVPAQVARKFSVLPFRRVGSALHLAMTCPWDGRAVAEVEFLTGLAVVRHVAISARMAAAFEKYHGVIAPVRQRALITRLDGPAPAAPRVPSPFSPAPAVPRDGPSDPSRSCSRDESLFETVPAGREGATGRAAAPTAEPRLQGLPERLGRARDRDEIGAAILSALAPGLRTVALFEAHGGRAFGWVAFPEPLEKFPELSIELSDLPAFPVGADGESSASGRVPGTPANRRILRALGIRFPAVLGLVPVVASGKAELYLLGEAASGAALPMALLRRCAAMAGTALEILALRSRLAEAGQPA